MLIRDHEILLASPLAPMGNLALLITGSTGHIKYNLSTLNVIGRGVVPVTFQVIFKIIFGLIPRTCEINLSGVSGYSQLRSTLT